MEEHNDKAEEMKSSQDGQLMGAALTRFNLLAGPKFQAGIKEHNPNGDKPLVSRDTLEELEKEWIDAWFYIQATREKFARMEVPADELNKRLVYSEDLLNEIEEICSIAQEVRGPGWFGQILALLEKYWKTVDKWKDQRLPEVEQ